MGLLPSGLTAQQPSLARMSESVWQTLGFQTFHLYLLQPILHTEVLLMFLKFILGYSSVLLKKCSFIQQILSTYCVEPDTVLSFVHSGRSVTQSCLILCDPVDCSPPGSSFHGILQARIPEWVAISFSRRIFPTQGSNPGLPHCWQTL